MPRSRNPDKTTIELDRSTHASLTAAKLGGESFSETIDRLLGNTVGIRGLVPADDWSMDFFLGEHRAGRSTDAATTLHRVFEELQRRREETEK